MKMGYSTSGPVVLRAGDPRHGVRGFVLSNEGGVVSSPGMKGIGEFCGAIKTLLADGQRGDCI